MTSHDPDLFAAEHPDPARRPRGWPIYIAIALLLVVALVMTMLGGRSFFGPRVPTPTPTPAPADLSAVISIAPSTASMSQGRLIRGPRVGAGTIVRLDANL